jgi:hypothetical protein
MSKKKIRTYCLVVDASVARAAGSFESRHPTGILCRDFLLAVRGVCHRIAWTEAIKAEWDKHESLFAQQWRVSMVRLGKLRPLQNADPTVIRDSLQEHCGDQDILAILLKDCHLIEAALLTDCRVASRDDRVRGHFASLTAAIDSLRTILWVNPAAEDEGAVEWLESGAPNEKGRRLRGH